MKKSILTFSKIIGSIILILALGSLGLWWYFNITFLNFEKDFAEQNRIKNLTLNEYTFLDRNQNGKLDVYEDERKSIEERVEDLLSQSRVNITTKLRSTNSVLYLKTNLWFGIKAGGSVGHISGVVNGLLRSGFNPSFASAEPPVMVDDSVPFISINPPSTFGVPYELNNYRFQNNTLEYDYS